MKTDRFSEWGIASVLPGAKYILERMQEELNYLQQVLAAHQENRQEGGEPKRRGRPPGSKNPFVKKAGSWAGMTKEERSQEMKRRQMVAQLRRGGQPVKMHPRDPRHPGHAEWVEKMRKSNKKAWANLSATQRKQRIARMVMGRVNGQATEATA